MKPMFAKQDRSGAAPDADQPAPAGLRRMPAADEAAAYLVYDGECPVCSAYVRIVRFREAAGAIELINARDGGPVVERIVQQGLDLDEGMVLIYGGAMYHGADCIHMLAMLSSNSGFINRINAAIFRSRVLSKYLYPILRFGRNTLLRILRRSPLDLHAD